MPKNSAENRINQKLTQTALKFLAYRDRFEKEIIKRLKKEIDHRKYPANSLNLIPVILEKLRKSGLINDQELIENYIRQQHYSNLRGPFVIRQKLIRLGAPIKQIDQTLKKLISPESQLAAIKKLALKRKLDNQDKKSIHRFQRFIVSRGFDYRLVFLAQK